MRVWITGVGAVTSLGLSARDTFERLLSGTRGLGEIDLFDTHDQRARIGAQVRSVEVPSGPDWSRASAFALHAAREALSEAKLDPKSSRVGLIVGGTTAGMFEDELRVARMIAHEEPRGPVLEMRSHPLSSTLDALDAAIGPFCRLRTVASACSSGASALALAMSWLASDESIDAVVAGGTDGLCRLTLTGFNALAAMDPEMCRPFDQKRRGMNLGEGAGFLVLERHHQASRRHAVPIAELASVSLGAEAHHITNPESTGVRAGKILASALRQANVEPSMIDYVNAHGTATPLNDSMEAKALAFSLGNDVSRIPVSSSKAQIGHTLGAAGAIEAIIATLALASGKLPPTVGLVDVDPECAGLKHLFSSQRVDRVRAAISSSFGFGGMDAAVVVTESEFAEETKPKVHRVVITGGAVIGPRGLVTVRDAESLTEGTQAQGRVLDLTSTLDAARARRLDRAGKLATIAVQAALPNGVPHEHFGVVMGSAYSAVDDCGAFMRRILDKGPRLASPADFPNLVPSSPIGHASIYLGLRGAAMATADLHASGESAIATAIEMIVAGHATAMMAGACPVASEIIDEVFVPLFADGTAEGLPRGESAAAIAFESREHCSGVPLAEVTALLVTRGDVPKLPAPRDRSRARVFARTQTVAKYSENSEWKNVQTTSVERGVGDQEGAGAAALVAAVGCVSDANSEIDDALVVGTRPAPHGTWAYFIVVRRV